MISSRSPPSLLSGPVRRKFRTIDIRLPKVRRYHRLMNSEQYQPALDALDLVSELKRLLVVHRGADRLICRYLADLADGMVNCPRLVLAYRNVHHFAHAQLGLSFRSIRERIRVGKALRVLPLLDAALTSGELTYSRIREVTRVATTETERLWLEAARRLPMRALELNVADACGEPRSRAGTPSTDTEPHSRAGTPPRDTGPANRVLEHLPGELSELLTRAMQLAQAQSGGELTDVEALAAVARGAIAHFTGRVERATVSSPDGTTHSGSSELRADEDLLVSKPNQGEVSEIESNQGEQGQPAVAPNGTPDGSHSGSARNGMAGTEHDGHGLRLTDKPLSPDEKVLLDLIYSGGSWNVATLCEETGMPPPRVAGAVFDLRVRRLVIQGLLGSLEVPPPTFKRAS